MLVAVAGALMSIATGPSAQEPSQPQAYVLTVADAIGPATRDYIVNGIEQAEEQQARLVVLRLDTPGGLDASMRDIIRSILNAEVPVATWVTPAGARAASAGTYMLYASHIAAMTSSTNLGAATPVQIGGGGNDDPGDDSSDDGDSNRGDDGGGSGDREEASDGGAGDDSSPSEPGTQPVGEAPGDASSRKAISDAVAYIKGLAERHGRNAEWAERAVREAASLPASEALDLNVIDLIADDLPTLLSAIDGREVQMADGPLTLETTDLEIVRIDPDWRTRLLSIITNPTLAYILMMVGIYGLILEGYNPGALVPGVIGGICLLLALYAFQILPVNYAGLALMALGFALIAVELFVPSFGILGIGGIAAVVAGSVILMDGDVPGFEMNTGMVAAMGLASALVFGAVVWLAARAIRKPRVRGLDSVVGLEAEAISDFDDGRGRVHLRGEDWSARANQPVRAGQRVRIIAMEEEGFVLDVAPVASPPPTNQTQVSGD